MRLRPPDVRRTLERLAERCVVDHVRHGGYRVVCLMTSGRPGYRAPRRSKAWPPAAANAPLDEIAAPDAPARVLAVGAIVDLREVDLAFHAALSGFCARPTLWARKELRLQTFSVLGGYLAAICFKPSLLKAEQTLGNRVFSN